MGSLQLNRPLVAVIMAYCVGLALALGWQPPLAVLFGALGVLLLSIPFLRQIRVYLVWLLLLLAGWTNLVVRTSVVAPGDLRTLLGADPAMVTVRGTLLEVPRLKFTVHDDREKWRSAARVRVREIQLGDNNHAQPASGEVLVTTPSVLGTNFFTGQAVEISGVIQHPPGPLAEGMFDFRSYLATRGIYYQLKTESTNDWKLLEPQLARPPLTDRFVAWSHQTLALGLPEEDETLRLIWAMTLDWKTAFTGDIGDPFLQAGTMHMFAIDGLRIALVSGIMVTLLRVFRLSRAWCGLVAIPAIWFYTAATGWESSAIRASVMMTIILGGWALKRPVDLLNSLAAAAFVILVIDPQQLFEASFQLSFFVMLVIALMLTPLNGLCDRVLVRVLGHDPLLPEDLVPRWRKRLLLWAQRFAHFCMLSFASWMGSLPLAAKYFHLFSPVSTLANVVAVPLGALALTANLGALICGHWLPGITVLFNHAAWFFMLAMTWVSVEAAKLPGAYFYLPEPSITTIVIYYVVIIAAFSGWFKTARRRVAGSVLLTVILVFYFWQWQVSRGQTDLTVLPVNGGHVTYVDAAGRQNDWLINCGNQEGVDLTLKNFLRGQGVNSLPRLVLTDAKARNCGGVGQLEKLFPVGELWASDVKFRSRAYRDALAGFDADPPGQPARHKVFHYGETNGCWRVLFPSDTAEGTRADDRALVLRGDIQGTRVLLLPELSRLGQSELLSQTNADNDLRSDIVIAGLPDQGEPLCDALLAAVHPKLIVIVDSEYPASRRASEALKKRLEEARAPVICTREAGAVRIVIDGSGWRVEHREETFNIRRPTSKRNDE